MELRLFRAFEFINGHRGAGVVTEQHPGCDWRHVGGAAHDTYAWCRFGLGSSELTAGFAGRARDWVWFRCGPGHWGCNWCDQRLFIARQRHDPRNAGPGGPNLLDMGVAFLSGIAAAYCLARPGLSSALAGVAIAAALVPPIATTGIAIAFGELSVAAGAALLFATNVVAIILGSALNFWVAGIRGKSLEPPFGLGGPHSCSFCPRPFWPFHWGPFCCPGP